MESPPIHKHFKLHFPFSLSNCNQNIHCVVKVVPVPFSTGVLARHKSFQLCFLTSARTEVAGVGQEDSSVSNLWWSMEQSAASLCTESRPTHLCYSNYETESSILLCNQLLISIASTSELILASIDKIDTILKQSDWCYIFTSVTADKKRVLKCLLC